MPAPDQFQNLLGTVGVTIANGASVSGSVYLNGQAIIGIVNAGTWTAAPLSFQTTADNIAPHAGGTWLDMYNTAGEVSLSAGVLLGTQAVLLPPSLLPSVQWVRLRSGLSAGGTNQGAARTIGLLVRPV